MNFSITDTLESGQDWSLLPFEEIKNEMLGESYTLSLAFVDEESSRKANKTYRDKDTATDILSFPLSENEGEILMCPAQADKKADEFGYELSRFLVYLFIHGCAHLKGYEHGEAMEEFEMTVRKKFQAE